MMLNASAKTGLMQTGMLALVIYYLAGLSNNFWQYNPNLTYLDIYSVALFTQL